MAWTRTRTRTRPADTGKVVTVALVGEEQRRDWLRRLLPAHARVVGELVDARKPFLIAGVAPSVVLLDGGSAGVNLFVDLPRPAALRSAPRVVVLTDGSAATSPDVRGALRAIGADVCADVRDAAAVAAALEDAREAALPPASTEAGPALAA